MASITAAGRGHTAPEAPRDLATGEYPWISKGGFFTEKEATDSHLE